MSEDGIFLFKKDFKMSEFVSKRSAAGNTLIYTCEMNIEGKWKNFKESFSNKAEEICGKTKIGKRQKRTDWWNWWKYKNK